MKPILITTGEPAGVGPELTLQLISKDRTAPIVAVGCLEHLNNVAEIIGVKAQLHPWQPGDDVQFKAHHLSVLPIALDVSCELGKLDKRNAMYVIKQLEITNDLCLNNTASAVVTNAVHKGIINESGMPFTGHTEFFQHRCHTDKVVMMLATTSLRVALATTHLPLKDVSSAITQSSLEQVIRILHQDLIQKFGIRQPRILVAGLNPHAGEGGHMGDEEITTITPVLEKLSAEGLNLIGPMPADTLFTPRHLDQADAALAMYHDQGLPVLKFAGFGRSVNITLGLPIIRTSVDHGTALDLAGTGTANCGSLRAALALAIELVAAQEAS